ncbi:hypothetical protein [Novosphingobium sp. PASSN1]|uniref:hypothetical protein n=1 Tax=Novosphingobium sp. PASSN1 TaxID=2015561 RepID=UPI000BDCD949|nr:hypothetical protein [Novosphingobium sp. PASSN1]OYU34191.1 MAG: hypothetical protein CFE35_16375 [Novosphingobium sp. PASSN1]
MPIATLTQLQEKSRSLQSLFSWLFGFGCFLLFSEMAYMPLKAVVLAGPGDVDAAWQTLGRTAVNALPSLALLAALWSARTLFRVLATGEVLTAASSTALGRVGDWLIVSAIFGLVLGPFGDKFDLLGTAYFGTLVTLTALGLAIRLLGRIHALAADIAADNRQII